MTIGTLEPGSPCCLNQKVRHFPFLTLSLDIVIFLTSDDVTLQATTVTVNHFQASLRGHSLPSPKSACLNPCSALTPRSLPAPAPTSPDLLGGTTHHLGRQTETRVILETPASHFSHGATNSCHFYGTVELRPYRLHHPCLHSEPISFLPDSPIGLETVWPAPRLTGSSLESRLGRMNTTLLTPEDGPLTTLPGSLLLPPDPAPSACPKEYFPKSDSVPPGTTGCGT